MASAPDSEFWHRLSELYTVICLVDGEGRLTAMSPLLERVLGSEAVGSLLGNLFEFKRPSRFDGSYGTGMQILGELVLGYNTEKGFALRGQLHDYSTFGLDGLCLVGVPWLWWMQENNPDHGLEFSDFPVLDIQMDQLFFVSAQQTMVADLEQLNDQLRLAQKQLKDEGERRQRFFGHVSHEMRTPLNGVISALTLIKDGQFDDRTSKFIRLAAHSANRLLEIINFSLDTVNPELDSASDYLEPFSMDSLIDDCLAVTQARALEKGLNLHRVGTQTFATKFIGHPRLLKQVLINLLGNAIKFTDEGDVTLSAVAMDIENTNGCSVEFRVEDQGPGIPEDVQSQIFEPFATGVTQQTQKAGGTGLGLNIAKRCVESMGGDLSVASAEGQGAVFSFKVVLTELSDNDYQRLVGESEIQAMAGLRGTVLLVDDEESNLSLNQQILASLGLVVETARSGHEAIECVKEKTFDLVLLDLNMQGMDGFEAAEAIRRLPDRDGLPIVALTARSDSSTKQRVIAAGMQGFLQKPILRDRLQNQLMEWVEHQFDDPYSLPEKADKQISSEDPVFVSEIIERLERDVGADMVRELVAKFLSESAVRWDSLQTALANNDLPVVAREAHTLGSSCFTFGLQRAGSRFRKLEAEAQNAQALTVDIEVLAADLGEGISGLEKSVDGP